MRRALLIVIAVLLVPAAAQARPRSGGTMDPKGDMSPGLVTGWRDDLAAVSTIYLPRLGVLQTTVKTYNQVGDSDYAGIWFNFYADVGRWQLGRCVPVVKTHFYTPDDAPVEPTPPDATLPSGKTLAGSYSNSNPVGATYDTFVYGFHDRSLRWRGLNCVTNILLYAGETDTAPGFRLRP